MSHPLEVRGVAKSFTMHLRGGLRLNVVNDVDFILQRGQCAVLGGPSGIGKSSILKMVYGNYSVDAGHILVNHQGSVVDLATADPRSIVDVRRETLGYVSQFLRTVPRVSALDVVAEPLAARGTNQTEARELAAELLARLNMPKELWALPPATFSGGEQQRVNIARGFITDHSIMLLDEPTASLDAANRKVVVDLIAAKKESGVALLGIFHDQEVREAVADTVIDVSAFSPRKSAA